MNVASYAYKAGFRGQDLVTATAIAYAESGGDPQNYDPETAAGTPEGFGSYGLWQIYRKAHPEFTSWDLYDPQTNANAAYRVYLAAGHSFTPWSTFNHGSYLKFLDQARAEVAAIRPATTITLAGIFGAVVGGLIAIFSS